MHLTSTKQENVLQKFELPELALCVGGFLLVELLGRVQKQEIDGLYYIWYSLSLSLCHSLMPNPMVNSKLTFVNGS